MSSFFISWAKLVRGLSFDLLPYHDRSTIAVPRNPPRPEFDHRSIEFLRSTTGSHQVTDLSSISNIKAHFSADFIAKLKAKVNISTALGLHQGVDTSEGGGGRESKNEAACTNGVFWEPGAVGTPEVESGGTAEGELRTRGNVIHEPVAKLDSRYFQSFFDFGKVAEMAAEGGEEEELVVTAPEVGTAMCPNLEVSSWMRFELHELDFGGGGPADVICPNTPVEGANLHAFFQGTRWCGCLLISLALLLSCMNTFDSSNKFHIPLTKSEL
ncbi:hypothetical protein NE237_032030 [Protea cynaroides]|uniref:Uncharacterized protein n=1 Tax=Protea cynaroides TaxID=273540 RepID=A0A9Q0R2Q5_9MAGN|nr:hypothetical protein NE237_032030 [Protea cynaroides]